VKRTLLIIGLTIILTTIVIFGLGAAKPVTLDTVVQKLDAIAAVIGTTTTTDTNTIKQDTTTIKGDTTTLKTGVTAIKNCMVKTESGSGTLAADWGGEIYPTPDPAHYQAVFPSTLDPVTLTGGYNEVRHVTLTYYIDMTPTDFGHGAVFIVTTLGKDPQNPGRLIGMDVKNLTINYDLDPETNMDKILVETIEFDAYQGWFIFIDDGVPNPNEVYAYVSYNYTMTYPSSQ
jgi:hypothetical protein